MNKLLLESMMKKGGTTAQKLLNSGMNVNSLRTNDTLRKDEWKDMDKAVLKVAQERLVGVADLKSRGLTFGISNGMGKTVLEYEDVSDIEAAEVSMDGVTAGKNDRVVYDIKYLPLPIIHKDFQITVRVLNASRTTGESLDFTMAELSSRQVAEKAEEILFQGLNTYTFGGGAVYGYVDQPNRNIGSLTANWDDSASSGETILNDVRAMKQAAIDAKHYGPYMLYVPTNYETTLDDDFKANSDKTIRQRILEISGIVDIRVADKLASDNVLLVQLTTDVVRWVEGMPLTTVEWQTEGNMIFHFKVMMIGVPQIRADQEGNSGVVHYT